MFLECYIICERPKEKDDKPIGFGKNGNKDILLKQCIDLTAVESYKETILDYEGVSVPGVFVVTGIMSYLLYLTYEEFQEAMSIVHEDVKKISIFKEKSL